MTFSMMIRRSHRETKREGWQTMSVTSMNESSGTTATYQA